jgi:putative methyltransferase (TIGR04325 family)
LGFRDVLRPFVPPIALSAVRRLRRAVPAEREYVGTSWPGAAPPSWDDSSHDATLRRNWPIVAGRIAGTGPLNMVPFRSDEADLPAHNMLLTFLYVAARAAHRKDRLSLLDWGGSLGHYALVARRLLPEIAFDVVVKEQPTNVRLAREFNPATTFVDSDDACFARRYDLVMANGALHCVPDWRTLIGRLAASADSWLLVTCLPVVRNVPGFVVVQRLRSSGFLGDYYSNVVNRDDFLAEATRHGFALERELMSWGPVFYKDAPEHPIGAGFLMRRRA